MGKITLERLEDDREHGANGKCFVCDGPSAAFWAGHKYVEICRSCAIRVLPALLADAVLPAAAPDIRHLDEVIPTVKAAFWKAVATAISLAARKDRERRDADSGDDVDEPEDSGEGRSRLAEKVQQILDERKVESPPASPSSGGELDVPF